MNLLKYKATIFIVVGRLGNNLVLSKTLPVVASGLFSNIYVFSERSGTEINGIKYITLPPWVKNIKPKFLKRIIRVLYEPMQLVYYASAYKPAIIHGYYSIPKGLNSLIAAKLIASKCIISIIGGKEEIERTLKFKRISRAVILKLLKYADHITTKGTRDNEYLVRHGIPEYKISIFNGSIDDQKFNYQNEPKDIDLLFVGYFDQYKGPHRALEIANLLKNQYTGITACFLGEGPLFEEVKRSAIKLRLTDNVVFKGQVNNPQHYYKRSKILVFPSANEGLSTAMLEAMACKCVPVISDVGNQTEAAKNQINSIVIQDYQNTKEFADQILLLLKDPEKLHHLAEQASLTILNKYSNTSQSRICSDFYLRLLNHEFVS